MTLFLAIVIVSSVPVGVQIEAGAGGAIAWAAPGSWIKYNPAWGGDMALYDREIAGFAGHPLLLNLRNSPPEYRLSAWECGPVDCTAWAAWAISMIDRYQPAAVEVWNEPDIPPSPGYTHLFGCWTDPAAYGKFAADVCDIIEAQRPEVVTLAGALAFPNWGRYIEPGHCNGLSFHYYARYSVPLQNDRDHLLSTIAQLQSYGHTNLWITETSLLNDSVGEKQADWFRFVRSLGIPFFWYTLGGNGWEQSDMVQGGIPRPVWYEYQDAINPYLAK